MKKIVMIVVLTAGLTSGQMMMGSAASDYDRILYVDASNLYADKPFPGSKKDFFQDYQRFAQKCRDSTGVEISLEDFVNCLKYIKSFDSDSNYLEDKATLVINLIGDYKSTPGLEQSFSEFVHNLINGVRYANLLPNEIAVIARDVDPFSLRAPQVTADGDFDEDENEENRIDA